MLYFNNTGSTTLTVWPEEKLTNIPGSGSLRLKLTSDYSQEVTYVPAILLNNPTQYSPRLIFSVTGSDLPQVSGLYTVEIQEYLQGALTWGRADRRWGEADFTWGSGEAISGIYTIDNDRVFNEGLNVPTATIYQSSQTGSYVVYNG
jgi:hypothetical protein